MLKIAKNLSELSFRQLMDVYVEGCLERGQELYPRESEARQIALGEEEFHNYLSQVFFRTPEAYYAMWEAEGKYVSALRLEPWQDGLLLEALETAPDQRRKGYAKALIQAVLARTGDTKIYSHVNKRNAASLRTHSACGFQRILDHARMADGSVSQRSWTLCYDGWERSCGGVVFTRENGEIRYVVIQSLGGEWGFPKGHMEPGESETQTALREIYEEVGLRCRILEGFRAENEYPLPGKPGVRKKVIYFLAEFSGQTLRHQKEELEAAALMGYEDARKLLRFDSSRRILAEAHRDLEKRDAETRKTRIEGNDLPAETAG